MDKTKKDIRLARGFQKAEAMTREYAKTFYFASRFMPGEKMRAAYVIYALCRLSDDSVDEQQPNHLSQIRQNIEASYGHTELEDPLLYAFREIVNQYGIPKEYFIELLKGMEMDLVKNHYDNFAELHQYCLRAAGAVGLIMLKLFGVKDLRAQERAIDLSIAMQLTNMIRDIKEDFLRGRIYLPRDEMTRYGISTDDLAAARMNNNLKRLLEFQASRAKQYYADSQAGIKLIPGIRCRLTVQAMKEMYAGILDAIENNHYDVFNKRAYLSAAGKIFVILRIFLGAKFI
jgi:15-cis-phytoene synthase